MPQSVVVIYGPPVCRKTYMATVNELLSIGEDAIAISFDLAIEELDE